MDFREEIKNQLRRRPEELKRAREKGKKVIGYFPGDFVPEELIHAAGGEPVCFIHGGDPESVDAAHTLVPRFLCPFARAQFGYHVLNEQPYYNLIDLLVAPITCQNLRRTADLWNHATDTDIFRLGIPHEYDSEDGLKYFIESLKRLQFKIESVTGNTVSAETLKKSIELYNKMRGLLKEISMLRHKKDIGFSSFDFISLNHASLLLDPEVMVGILNAALSQLRNSKPISDDRPRLILTGPCIALGDTKILHIVKESGGDIVMEEICEGVRCYRQNVETEGNLIDNLGARYLRDRVPWAYMRMSSQPRLEYLLRLVKEYQADGILWYQLKYCETYDFESFYMAKKMEEAGIPFIKLESEYDVSDRGPLKTRVEAFIETIKERRGK